MKPYKTRDRSFEINRDKWVWWGSVVWVSWNPPICSFWLVCVGSWSNGWTRIRGKDHSILYPLETLPVSVRSNDIEVAKWVMCSYLLNNSDSTYAYGFGGKKTYAYRK
ncbi:hypothetical protein MANES_02G160150v8 [Manihot esculenta]|uniref:Uncharacterized protein n=1 Tax=Manihot esculenta TaxID=3983 RepID=A0ACB7I6S2_MANES|nr:hypothetical protein MANES_02G160150v8 [Manihot esculenta]